jgi:hypothetical protein
MKNISWAQAATLAALPAKTGCMDARRVVQRRWTEERRYRERSPGERSRRHEPFMFVLVVLAAVTVAAGTAHAAGTIGFADPVVEVAEGGSKSVLVVRTGDASDAATVVLTADSGSAAAGTDFAVDLPTSTVELPPGVTFRRVTVTALADADPEGVEFAHLTLSSASGAAIGGQSELLLLIRDAYVADAPSISFAATNESRIEDTIYTSRLSTVDEGRAVPLTIIRSSAADAGTVDLRVIGGTATLGVDFSDPTATLAFPAGTASIDVDFATLDDADREGAETVQLLLERPTPPGTALQAALATVLIDDDEASQAGQLALRATSAPGRTVQVAENAGNAQFRVERTGGTTGPVTIDYAAIGTATGGAIAGEDFVASTGTLTFPDGTGSATFSIPIIDDNVVNLFAGTDFRVILANPTGGATIDPTASSMTVQLQDNEELKLCDDGTNNCLEGFIGVGGCFIATAAYGSYLDPHVVALRKFRDRYLQTNAPGRAFVRWYYAVSPRFAIWLARHDLARTITRVALTPLVYTVAKPRWAAALLLLVPTFALGARLTRRRGFARRSSPRTAADPRRSAIDPATARADAPRCRS